MRGCTTRDALRGGEEYELVVASPHALDVNAFARAFALPLSEVGRARPSAQPAVTLVGEDRADASSRVDPSEGHDHFSS
jgi:thiamine monophosphate kinase